MALIGPFTVLEFIGLIVALIGLVPVLSQHQEDLKWFTAGYGLLVAGMIATNLETVILPVTLNVVEHVVGIGFAGIVFFFAAYQRQQTLDEGEV